MQRRKVCDHVHHRPQNAVCGKGRVSTFLRLRRTGQDLESGFSLASTLALGVISTKSSSTTDEMGWKGQQEDRECDVQPN